MRIALAVAAAVFATSAFAACGDVSTNVCPPTGSPVAPARTVTVTEALNPSAVAPAAAPVAAIAPPAAPRPTLQSPGAGLIRLSGVDLAAQTHKWDGKIIETKASCFYADVNEFRCLSGHFRVDFESLAPDDLRQRLETNCDTISKSGSRSCTVTLRFEYSGFHSMDVGGFAGQFTIVEARDNAGFIVKK